MEKKRPPATGGHTLQRKDRDHLEVEPSFRGRNFEGARPVAGKAAHLSPRPASRGILNASEGSLKGWGPSLLAPTRGLNQNVFGARIQLGNNTIGPNLFSKPGPKRRHSVGSMGLLKGRSLSPFTPHPTLQNNCSLVSKLGQSRLLCLGGAIEVSKFLKNPSQGHHFVESSRVGIPRCSKSDDESGAATSWEKENLTDAKGYFTTVSPSPSSLLGRPLFPKGFF